MRLTDIHTRHVFIETIKHITHSLGKLIYGVLQIHCTARHYIIDKQGRKFFNEYSGFHRYSLKFGIFISIHQITHQGK